MKLKLILIYLLMNQVILYSGDNLETHFASIDSPKIQQSSQTQPLPEAIQCTLQHIQTINNQYHTILEHANHNLSFNDSKTSSLPTLQQKLFNEYDTKTKQIIEQPSILQDVWRSFKQWLSPKLPSFLQFSPLDKYTKEYSQKNNEQITILTQPKIETADFDFRETPKNTTLLNKFDEPIIITKENIHKHILDTLQALSSSLTSDQLKHPATLQSIQQLKDTINQKTETNI